MTTLSLMSRPVTQQQIAENVRVALARRGLSQSDLARHLYGRRDNTTALLTSRRVHGVTAFKADELAAVAEFLGVPIADLLAAA